MKRALALLLILTLVLPVGLSACGGRTEPVGVSPSPAPAAEPLPEGFVTTMEYDRLYLLCPDSGRAVLLADRTTTAFDRLDDTLYASFDDGSAVGIDLHTGETRELLPPGSPTIMNLHAFRGGFLAEHYSMRDSAVYVWTEESGELRQLPIEDYYISPAVADGFLAYEKYDDDRQYLTVCALPSGEELWRTEVPGYWFVQAMDGEIYLFRSQESMSRLDSETRTLVPVELPVLETDLMLRDGGNGFFLLEGNGRLSAVSARGRAELEDLPDWVTVSDLRGRQALFRSTDWLESPTGENWYPAEAFYLADLNTGEVSPVEIRGRYGSLFAGGDFPVMDSSTARKPVTAAIHDFFCESTGAGGAMPLCSTTHYAWLNMADGGADIALLAAPTPEELDYLHQKGVEVEMKLYGGDGLVFIGNRACGVTDLTLDQLRAIYRGEITNWSQVGGADHPIRVLFRDDQSGSQRLFERLLWGGGPVPDLEALGFERLDDMSTIVGQCLYDPYSIGYSIMTYLRDVYGNEDLLSFSLDGAAATPENVAAGLYPLSTQGYVVIRADEPADSPARRLYDWFGSPLSDYILTSCGVTPLH